MLQLCKQVYRRTIPSSVRSRLYHLRQVGRRDTLKQRTLHFRLATGRTIAHVRLPHADLLVDLRDGGVGTPLYLYGSYEVCETRFLQRILRPGMTVLDAGANIGYFTTLASREVTRSGQVIAVEPDPYNFALLAANVRANRCRRVALIRKALGAEPGIAQLYRSERNYGDHRLYGGGGSAGRSSISVPVVTVDSLAANLALSGVDVVKLDVQGFEHHVIRGMSKTISQNDNLLIVSEIWPFGLRQAGASPRGLVDDLLARGFALYALDGSSPRLIAPHRLSLLLSEWDAVAAAKDERFYINVAFAKGALMREIVAGRQEGL